MLSFRWWILVDCRLTSAGRRSPCPTVLFGYKKNCDNNLERTCSNHRRRPDVAYLDCDPVSVFHCVVDHSDFAGIVGTAAGYSYLKISKKLQVPMNDPVFPPSKYRFVLTFHESNHSLGVAPSLTQCEISVENFSPFVHRGASLAFGREHDHF